MVLCGVPPQREPVTAARVVGVAEARPVDQVRVVVVILGLAVSLHRVVVDPLDQHVAHVLVDAIGHLGLALAVEGAEDPDAADVSARRDDCRRAFHRVHRASTSAGRRRGSGRRA